MKTERSMNADPETVNPAPGFARPLMDWYQAHHRDLPFRRDREPYHIWVSEIMAQQTRIEAMVQYYDRFMTLFPTVQDLAAADEDTLHRAWQGLGYYSRVRNLQKAAQIVAREGMPRSKKELQTLPGIGPYTAGAIASISFGEKAAAVDGNVLRVFARLYDIREDVTKPAVKREIEARVLDAMIEPYGEFNQAIMELGALVCTPGTPDCAGCPVNQWCLAKDPASLPVLPEKKRKTEEEKTFLIYTDGYRMHLEKRPAKGLLAGLYGFPEGEVSKDTTGIHPLPRYDHVFTHKIWHISGWLVPVEQGAMAQMYTPEEIEAGMAVPTAFQPLYKAACRLLAEGIIGRERVSENTQD